jgi:hypothetical protein
VKSWRKNRIASRRSSTAIVRQDFHLDTYSFLLLE